ncbi:MAG TPA: hypothetical protein DIT54_02590 [Lachnospiraceae bacterium]|nr:hypothetical protein [Lachnospiraceae bacterium]
MISTISILEFDLSYKIRSRTYKKSFSQFKIIVDHYHFVSQAYNALESVQKEKQKNKVIILNEVENC